jgi:hypothetical protein
MNRKAVGLLALVAGVVLIFLGIEVNVAFGEREADCFTFVYLILGCTGLWKGFVMIQRAGRDGED